MRADAARRRERLITAACHLMSTRHEDAVPLEDIAAHADVGIATLYRNFPDRTALVHACARHLFTLAIDAQEKALTALDGPDPDAAWHSHVRELVAMGLGTMVPVLAPDNLDELPADLADLRARASDLARRIARRAQQAGLIHPDIDPGIVLLGIFTVTRPQVPGVAAVAPDLSEQLLRIYLSGLRAGPDLTGA